MWGRAAVDGVALERNAFPTADASLRSHASHSLTTTSAGCGFDCGSEPGACSLEISAGLLSGDCSQVIAGVPQSIACPQKGMTPAAHP